LRVALTSLTIVLATAVGSRGIQAAVPANIAKQLAAIGRGVCIPETAKIYRPLHPNPPYRGVSIARNRSFGPDPLNVVDVFYPETGSGPLPVLLYVPGGGGNKQEEGPNSDVFYDNIMLWAVKNGMVGVDMQRRPPRAWDAPAKDVGLAVKWVNQNISRYKGNPARVFIWAQSSGNVPVATYLAHPELWGGNQSGIRGAIFMSPPKFNILPADPQPVAGGALAACGQPNGQGPLVPVPAGGATPAGPVRVPGKRSPPPVQGRGFLQADAATELKRSNIPGLINSKLPLFVSVAELDPGNVVRFAEALRDQLCKAGRCPTYVVFKDHSHVSQVMSPDTSDTSVTGPILEWIKSLP